MSASTTLAALWHRSGRITPVPRAALTFVRLTVPALGRRQLLAAVRLQLTQYMPAGPFGFVCRAQRGGSVVAWAWAIGADAGSPRRSGYWAESALDAPAQGLRLVRRSAGFEAQQWVNGELLHSRWFEAMPNPDDWQRFARGCGVDPQDHPLPKPAVAARPARPPRGWRAGDNLPETDPWQGWHWQVGALVAGAVVAAALGAHMQARDQLRIDTQRLAALSSGREAALQARTGYEQAATDLESLRALAPRLSQLELLDRVTTSGIFTPVAATNPSAPRPPPAQAGAGSVPGMPLVPVTTAPAATRLLEWDYRNGQLKMKLELPDRNVTLLGITRRLEQVPGLGLLRVGQDSADNTLTLSALVVEEAGSAANAAGLRRASTGR